MRGKTRNKKTRRRSLRRRKIKKSMRGGADLKFAVMAQFKNEKMAIEEWVAHYKWQGVDEILLLNNESSNAGGDLVKGKENVTILDAPGKAVQRENYNNIGRPWLEKNKIDLVLIVDLDEFVYATEKGKSLKQRVVEIFSAPDRPSVIDFRWMIFGSNGFDKQPASIRKSFTKRYKDVDPNIFHVKSISFLKDIKPGGLALHSPEVNEGGRILNSPPGIQINHYRSQSKEFFKTVKMTRGAANTIENHRDLKNFEEMDKFVNDNPVQDTGLKELVEAAEKEGLTPVTPDATDP